MEHSLPVVVVGAGPVGLAAAAHLRQREIPYVVLEAGEVGAAVREWGHVRTFTPWQWLVDPVAGALLTASGRPRPAGPVPPTGDELVDQYLVPLADALGDAVRTGTRVVAVARDGAGYAVTVATAGGRVEQVRARAVLDASGTWRTPAPLGVDGPATGEQEAVGAGLVVGALPDVLGRDRPRFAGRRTLVVGAGHSAAQTLLALAQLSREEPGTSVVWAVRGDVRRVFGGGEADQLEARGRLGSDLRRLVDEAAVELVRGFATSAVEVDHDGVTVVGTDGRRLTGLSTVVRATGFRPDLSVLSGVRLDLDPRLHAPRALAPLIDPALHSCGTVPPHGHRELAQPDAGLYVVGAKSYGRAPTFLVTTGNEQVRSVVAALAGDTAAADAVELVLPETGVCSTGATGEDLDCCGPAEAHGDRSAGQPAQGFATGLPGGGTTALELVPAGEGCCAG